jgi:Ca2+-transporting ATPase
MEVDEVLKEVNSSVKGLSSEDAQQRLNINGRNVLVGAKKLPAWLRLLKQLQNMMMIIMSIALVLSLIMAIAEDSAEKFFDVGMIGCIILLNMVIGFVQENKAEKSVEALKKASQPFAKVTRDGKGIKIRTDEIVVGDIIHLEAGDIVPADMRLVEVASLLLEESSLTGESVPVEKVVKHIEVEGAVLGDRKNLAFAGGVVTYGRGKGVVIATGMNTQIGLIAGHLNEQKAPETPLTIKMNQTVRIIAYICGVVAAFIFVSRAIMGASIFDSLLIVTAISVCAIPEALPTCVTIIMAIGVQRMSKKRAIVRNLPAVETLGSTEIICSDKTGTLTLNKMTVQKFYICAGADVKKNVFNVDFTDVKTVEHVKSINGFKHLKNCMLLCNDSHTTYENATLTTIGDPTETALIHFAHEYGFSKEYADTRSPRLDEIPFDSERKLMSTMHQIKEGEFITYTKGALDNLIVRCSKICEGETERPMTTHDREMILKQSSVFANGALRVLGYSYKIRPTRSDKLVYEDENDMVFVGFSGMIDPPREEVFESIKTCKTAGIIAIMITGDHRDTAFAIAKQIGIATNEDQVITGAQLETMDDKTLAEHVFKYRVYARVNPEHKVRIVKAFKSHNKIVAMTGDGVNDAASIKTADIGVGMGITGTDVTKGAADVILTDDNFATIVTAVEEGRRTYDNIVKLLIYLVGLSLSELILLTGIIVVFHLPFFNPLLILWVNVVTDTLPAICFAFVGAEAGIMKRRPVKVGGSLFRGYNGYSIMVYAFNMTALVLTGYLVSLYALDLGVKVAVTISYVILAVAECVHSYNLISMKNSMFKSNPFTCRAMNIAAVVSILLIIISLALPITAFQNALGITQLTTAQWVSAAALGLMMIPLAEIYKLIMRVIERKIQVARRV